LTQRFVGIDLGWYGKPTGLASLELTGRELSQRKLDRLQPLGEIFDWIVSEVGNGSAVVAVDAPLVITNESGLRPAERDLNRDFRRFHAGCHVANLSRPFAQHVTRFNQLLEERGFRHGVEIEPCQPGRFQIEVHPHAATVALFGLDRIVKYKRGPRDERARELRRLRRLMMTCLATAEPALKPQLPGIPRMGPTKPAEDMIDALLCAYVAAHWWLWAVERNSLYGTAESGYIVVPRRPGSKVAKRPRGSWGPNEGRNGFLEALAHR
jgi:predicted RNase H-like nuclease